MLIHVFADGDLVKLNICDGLCSESFLFPIRELSLRGAAGEDCLFEHLNTFSFCMAYGPESNVHIQFYSLSKPAVFMQSEPVKTESF